MKRYDADWDSLDKRIIPEWFLDAKFGALIMWGPYSVPAFGGSGDTYSEWYEFYLKANDEVIKRELTGHFPLESGQTTFTYETALQDLKECSAMIKEFHYKTYGKDFRYENFYDMFKAELFNPDEWVDIFSKAGLKHIVLSAKHHGGFCLFPSKHEMNGWGYPKDSVHIGPKRDILSEVFSALRNAGIKPGIYYSMYEWFNPLWLNDRALYVDKVTIPQLKDIVNKYKPANIWNDGDWHMDYKGWRSEEIIAWLFNESPVADEIVINDRWGQVNARQGSYFTTEYGGGFRDIKHPWEESRGIDSSYGYKRDSTYFEYKSAKKLIHTLIDIVSRGGNLLLNIPPRADGRFPNLIVERLVQIGAWLKINGEAIYGTRPYKKSYQWNADNDYEIDFGKPVGSAFDITKYTNKENANNHPIIEAFFTSKPGILYAILPNWLTDDFTLKDFIPSVNTKITMLGLGDRLSWEKSGNNVIIQIPKIFIDEVPCKYAYVIKLEK